MYSLTLITKFVNGSPSKEVYLGNFSNRVDYNLGDIYLQGGYLLTYTVGTSSILLKKIKYIQI
jgi:hypothetical protein